MRNTFSQRMQTAFGQRIRNAFGQRSRSGGTLAPHYDLAVQHGTVGQVDRQRGEFGKALGGQFFAACPYPQLAGALDELRADAVPLPLHLPIARRPESALEIGSGKLQRMRQEERVGLPHIARVGVALRHHRDKPFEVACARPRRQAGVAHQPLRNAFGIDAGQGRQGPCHEQLGNTDAEATRDELYAHQLGASVELQQQRQQLLVHALRRQRAQGQQLLLDPDSQAFLGHMLRLRQ